MTSLPTGTVTLLFSDIEGSTALLSRLGPAYAQALTGQRQILRAAWAAHEGVELGTEGDSFFVAFATAGDAVAAAAQAQRGLAVFGWPGGELVKIRMGIHTGSPQLHEDGYIGMDVHRAARIAGSAHGGQVVLSQATAHLTEGCLPAGVAVRDLGNHHLKDIPVAERLFQLDIDGLSTDFAQLKTLGAASGLPVPTTALVGREGECAELTALLSSPDARVVTLTGPGGSGKTRLAISVAHGLVKAYPDGVYFVPLASVTTPDVMWTSIAEVLDVPPEGRIPPAFFGHVAHRSALLLLDNLEQLSGADQVVSELLSAAPQVVVVATSRRPLRVAGEREHPVPPLELPDTPDTETAQRSGAVQLFLQHATLVKPSFALTPENVGDIAEICRRLDGLPLAIELAAARSKLLSPTALLARLGKALELKDARVDRPTRQQTLHNTIAWSYDLLTPHQQAFFLRLSVFAGGADFDAIDVVTADALGGADPLDLVGDLVDASLATVTEDAEGEPRVGMLQTIRAYAQQHLTAAGELNNVRAIHAGHYLQVAQRLHQQLMSGGSEQLLTSRRTFELDIDNFRDAVAWALNEDAAQPQTPEKLRLGVQLCAALYGSWADGGYFSEGRRWLERAVSVGGEEPTRELGQCLIGLADLTRIGGDVATARTIADRSVDMCRKVHDDESLSIALTRLADCELRLNNLPAARHAYEEAIELSRETSDLPRLAHALTNLAHVEAADKNFERSLESQYEALKIRQALGNERGALRINFNIACILREMGRSADAYVEMRKTVLELMPLIKREDLSALTEDYGALLAELGAFEYAVRLLGAADALRERIGTPRHAVQEAEIEAPFTSARGALPADVWDREYHRGRAMDAEDALVEAHAATGDLEKASH